MKEETEHIPVGIEQIGIQIPSTYIPVEKIAKTRKMDPNKATKGLKVKRARIPYKETLPELAAKAVEKIEYEDVKTFFFATESNPDASKPEIALKTLEILGLHNVVCIPTTFACVAGIQSVVAGCKISAGTGEPVIVITADRSIYRHTEPAAEITQGCMAAAVRIEPNPKYLDLDYRKIGVFLADIDDFKVPWYWYPTPKIDDHLIRIGYLYCVKNGLLNWEKNNQRIVKDLQQKDKTIIDYLDFINPHCPYLQFVEIAMASLYQFYKERYDKDKEKTKPRIRIENVMQNKKLWDEYKESLDKIRKENLEFNQFYQQKVLSVLGKYNPEIGNSYNGSVFGSSTAILEEAKKEQIVGIAGYGSGAGSVIIKGTVTNSGFQGDLRKQLNEGTELTLKEYKQWRRKEMKKEK